MPAKYTPNEVAQDGDTLWILMSGGRTRIDARDYEAVRHRRWSLHGAGYASSNKGVTWGPAVLMHRLLMAPGPGLQVDHVDGDRLNNTRSNLRIVTHRENHHNVLYERALPRGVYYSPLVSRVTGKVTPMWDTKVKHNGRSVHLGRFSSVAAADEAAKAGRALHLTHVNESRHN